ncbi:hypothetical protein TW95_gp1378 [Pandoravirus inopinatum]|uniref:Uncharacterized protein n=1 Tax=Pandoravirus inopinatum TaxID=1605721 RepID=A0A0B5JEB4_9VIRU|nr:hypothetical protein TW95_gp1378 [Pandoravirus inopinatum]AJF98112.1 hypothetical protein [Pandoravirus inopinatum]
MPSWPTTLMMLALIAQTPLLAMTVMILKEAASPTDRGSFQFLDVYWQVRPFFSLCCASCRSWSLFTLWWGVAFGPQPKIVGRVPGASVLCLCFLSFFGRPQTRRRFFVLSGLLGTLCRAQPARQGMAPPTPTRLQSTVQNNDWTTAT